MVIVPKGPPRDFPVALPGQMEYNILNMLIGLTLQRIR